MTTLQQLEAELSSLIVRVANLSHMQPSDIDPSASLLRDGLGLDSIDILELVVNLEKNYGMKLHNDEESRNALSSLRNLATFTQRHLEGATKGP